MPSGTEDNVQEDSITIELNGADPDALPALPDRPSTKAPREEWVAYDVALGADEFYLENDTEHYDSGIEATVTKTALTQEELIELADRLGG